MTFRFKQVFSDTQQAFGTDPAQGKGLEIVDRPESHEFLARPIMPGRCNHRQEEPAGQHENPHGTDPCRPGGEGV